MKQNILITLLLSVNLSLHAQVNLDSIRQVFNERITKSMKKNNVIGASVAVVSSEGLLWIDNFGFENLATEKEVTENTVFGIGSVTKVFTGTSVMQLVDQDKVDLDAPFRNYLPNFNLKGDHAGITTRNIMTHHSGLPSDIFKGMFSNKPENYKVVVDYMNQEYLAGVPNQIRAYSNSGYTLLGHMIAEVSGMEYDQYVMKHILKPLEMNSSAFNALNEASLTYDGKGKYQKDALLRDLPAGGLFSSANDMSKFLVAYMSKSEKLLKAETYNRVQKPQHPNTPLDFSDQFALGWSMAHRPYAGEIFYHTGTTLHFNAAMAFSPSADLGVIILTNSDNGGSIYREVHNIIESLSKASGLGKTEGRNITDLGNDKRLEVSPNELEQYAGVYVTPGANIQVYQKRKKLFMKMKGLRAELIPVGEDTFLPKIILLKVIPMMQKDNRMHFEKIDGYSLLTNSEVGSQKEIMAMKLTPQVIPNAWKARTGEYKVKQLLEGEIEFFTNYKLLEKDGLLIFSFEQKNNGQKIEMTLQTINDTLAKVAGLGRYAGQTVIYENGMLKAFGL